MRYSILLRRPLMQLWQAKRNSCHHTYCGTDGAYTATGALRKAPLVTKLGLFRIIAVVVAALGLGGAISKEAAAYLEEQEIFVPEDDDD